MDALEKEFNALWEEVSELYFQWNTFRQLFTDRDNRDMMNSVAPGFFSLTHDLLRDSIFQCICRLTDPSKTMGKDNLTLSKFAETLRVVGYEEASERIHTLVETVKTSTHHSLIRQHRNRRISHTDMRIRLEEETLPHVTIMQIQHSLDEIVHVMSTIESELFDAPITDFGESFAQGDAESLLVYLRK